MTYYGFWGLLGSSTMGLDESDTFPAVISSLDDQNVSGESRTKTLQRSVLDQDFVKGTVRHRAQASIAPSVTSMRATTLSSLAPLRAISNFWSNLFERYAVAGLALRHLPGHLLQYLSTSLVEIAPCFVTLEHGTITGIPISERYRLPPFPRDIG